MEAPFIIEWWPPAYFQAMEQEWMDKMKLVEAANEMDAEKKQQMILNLERLVFLARYFIYTHKY